MDFHISKLGHLEPSGAARCITFPKESFLFGDGLVKNTRYVLKNIGLILETFVKILMT